MNKAGEAEEKMTGGFHRVYALVDLDAVRENLQEMKGICQAIRESLAW